MDLIINTIITTTATAVGILLLKMIFKNKISSKLNLYIWLILVIRMMFMFFPQSQFSFFNIVPTVDNVRAESQQLEYTEAGNTAVESEYITGDIVLRNYSKPFAIKKSIENISINIWLIGAAMLFSYLLIVYILFSLKLRRVDTHKDQKIISLLREYKDKMNIKGDVALKIYGSTPMLKGILKPVIILPGGYNSEEIRQMIIHELCHLKHNDILLNMISTIFLCLNWYNPIIWACYSVFKRDIEVSCDQRVIEITGNKKDYATLLVKTSFKYGPSLPMTTCMNNGKNEIKRRISFMANFKKPNLLWTIIIAISIALLGAGCLSSGVNLKANDIWAPPFEELQWGMSEAEVMDVLGLTDDDVNSNPNSFSTKKEDDLFGLNRKVSFEFLPGEDALTIISVLYDEEDLDIVEKEITKKLGEGEYSYYYGESFLDKFLGSVVWKSELVSDQSEHLDIITDILDSYGPELSDRLNKKLSEMPLVSYTLNRDKTNRMYGELTINGGSAAMINEPEKFSNKD